MARFILLTHFGNKELQQRSTRFKAVARARQKRIWDPILYLPATTLQRHRLIKWRTHWLPSYPLGKCRCGLQTAHRDHYDIGGCTRIEPMVQQLHGCLGPSIIANKPTEHIFSTTY